MSKISNLVSVLEYSTLFNNKIIHSFKSSQIQDIQHQQLVDQFERQVNHPNLSPSCSFLSPLSPIALKQIMSNDGMELEIIINPKTTDEGHSVIQLETAAGAAIKHFKNAHGINVPRKRFLPVKSCSDLLLIKSDIYSLQHGQLVINEQRMFETTPVIKLGDHFKKVTYSFFFFLSLEWTLYLCLYFFVDPSVPEEVQEDSQDFGT